MLPSNDGTAEVIEFPTMSSLSPSSFDGQAKFFSGSSQDTRWDGLNPLVGTTFESETIELILSVDDHGDVHGPRGI
jgi:hypothetical protein